MPNAYKYESYGILSRRDMNNLITIGEMKIGKFFEYIALNQGTLTLIAKGDKQFSEGNLRLIIKVFSSFKDKVDELNTIVSLALAKDYYGFYLAVKQSELKILDKRVPESQQATLRGFQSGPTWFCKKVNRYNSYLMELKSTCENYPLIMEKLKIALEQKQNYGSYEV